MYRRNASDISPIGEALRPKKLRTRPERFPPPDLRQRSPLRFLRHTIDTGRALAYLPGAPNYSLLKAPAMPRYIAFLRAINVGGRNVKMDLLCSLFESLGFANVEPFIASGNIVFDARSKSPQTLERKIEDRLREALGYEVATFIRTDAELATIAAYGPFSQSDIDEAAALNIAFLDAGLDDESERKLMALRTEVDDFHVHGREVYWLCRRKQSDSRISNALIERTLGRKTTLRGANTVRRMAEKYS